MEAISNYQNRTKYEENQSGDHSLFKLWYQIIESNGYEPPNGKYFLSYKNRTVSRAVCYQYLKDYVEKRHHLKQTSTIKKAQMIDNQADELLQVYDFGKWRNPTESEIQTHKNNSRRR